MRRRSCGSPPSAEGGQRMSVSVTTVRADPRRLSTSTHRRSSGLKSTAKRRLLPLAGLMAPGNSKLVVFLTEDFHQLIAGRRERGIERDREGFRECARVVDGDRVDHVALVDACPPLDRVEPFR